MSKGGTSPMRGHNQSSDLPLTRSSQRSSQPPEPGATPAGEPQGHVQQSDDDLQHFLSAPAGEPGHDAHEATLFESFFSWPPPTPARDPLDDELEAGQRRRTPPAPMTPEAKRAMWTSLAMFAVSFSAIVCYWIYNHVVMPAPAELTDPDAFELPTPLDGPATEVLGLPALRAGQTNGPRLATDVAAATAEPAQTSDQTDQGPEPSVAEPATEPAAPVPPGAETPTGQAAVGDETKPSDGAAVEQGQPRSVGVGEARELPAIATGGAAAARTEGDATQDPGPTRAADVQNTRTPAPTRSVTPSLQPSAADPAAAPANP